MGVKINIVTLYPQMFPGFLNFSLAGKALESGAWQLHLVNIRDFAQDKHKSVDDTPAGGGAGMVLRADILAKAIDSIADEGPKFLLSPRGRRFTQLDAKAMAKLPAFTLICGRFEGVDQRVIDQRSLEEISIGDFIVSGGEAAAFAILDSIIRLLPGTMHNMQSAQTESFENHLLEYPHYTKPRIFENIEVPSVLLNGNHKEIEKWRYEQAAKLTRKRRPDLWRLHKKLLA
ncbi:tRNA (guanosine(37)-N1)-methyltransferase TrmD [Bartonella sp. TP]|uniref:tRNA (guanosine(37)-N1)-methyltransferase TrmD n=1 Tax=Bartonella sp. TP TaxID=3057550 RepID=UPI0025AFD303|nr:tRNA (guanosine(37)-N1)-methyltransferase TrmD [Bartonella sp. TP]MDN5248521.1 tRNA (guanosine(37)-N1)-methyltransferase TrmD [Alphaproteobacteria bacterium]WJW79555.1 tRNA (guanosine(37)-N1)-methyltransferase TrmD [Bartonella sp. TP]